MTLSLPRRHAITLITILTFAVTGGIATAAAATMGLGISMETKPGYGTQFRLRWCGNGTIEHREKCDDGNRKNGDGCSWRCQMERGNQCYGHRIGENFKSPDGCNTCTCTANGAACTKMYCIPQSSSSSSKPPAQGTKCFSSDQCGTGQYCTTDDGDCQSACEPGADMCIQVCAGVCKSNQCKPHICPDGTQHPSCSADGHPINYFADPCLTHQTSSRSSAGVAMSCDLEKRQYEAVISSNTSCQTNADCTVFVSGCPLVTCGVAINKNAAASAQTAADSYTSCRDKAGQPLPCAKCAAMTATCQAGRCVGR